MPELPETETIARELDGALAGKVLSGARVVRADVLRHVTPRQLDRRIRGATITRGWRRAKHVLLDLSTGDRIAIQPRFTGRVIVRRGGRASVPPYLAVEFRMADGSSFCYADVRRLGTVSLLDPAAMASLEARLGVEPLDGGFTTVELSSALRASRQAVKKVLMDQRRIAGVGNIYANEALWVAGIDPSRPASRVSAGAVERLRDAVVTVLSDAVAARGTTFRDYRDPSGQPGDFGLRLAVYGREGRPCPRCGTRVACTHLIDGRSTYFCFRCQR